MLLSEWMSTVPHFPCCQSAMGAGPVVHVLDASRGVPVAQTLLDKTRSLGFVEVRQAGTTACPVLHVGQSLWLCRRVPCHQRHRLATVIPRCQVLAAPAGCERGVRGDEGGVPGWPGGPAVPDHRGGTRQAPAGAQIPLFETSMPCAHALEGRAEQLPCWS